MTNLNEKKVVASLQDECERLREENAFLKHLLETGHNISDKLLNIFDESTAIEQISPQQEKQKTYELHGKQEQTRFLSDTLTSVEKIVLYRSLFRGREDVYAVRWEAKKAKNGRAGYSPACANEWDRRVCHKPRVKCGECINRKLLPITDKVIYDHLTGKHMIGVYPFATR